MLNELSIVLQYSIVFFRANIELLSLLSFFSLGWFHSLVASFTDNLGLGWYDEVESHLLPVLRELPHLLGGVIPSAGVGHLNLYQLVLLLHRGDSLAVPSVSGVLLKLLPKLELNLGVLEAGERL